MGGFGLWTAFEDLALCAVGAGGGVGSALGFSRTPSAATLMSVDCGALEGEAGIWLRSCCRDQAREDGGWTRVGGGGRSK